MQLSNFLEILNKICIGEIMLKNAIIVVSFGTSYESACNSGILPIENAIKKKFFDYKVVRAFTSGIIRRKIKQRDNVAIDSPAEAIEKLMRSGYTNIIVQPTLLIPGIEYEKLSCIVEEYKNISSWVNIFLGKSLLHDDSAIKELSGCISGCYNHIDENTALVLMGHGTVHFANSIYYKLLSHARKFRSNVFITVVESDPSFEDVVCEIAEMGIKKVILKPFMIVAGDHVINDMSSDEESSLKSLFAKNNIECECIHEGIGGCSFVHNIFIKHIEDLTVDFASL